MLVVIKLTGKRGTNYELQMQSTPEGVRVKLVQIMPAGAWRELANGLESEASMGSRLLAGWFGELK